MTVSLVLDFVLAGSSYLNADTVLDWQPLAHADKQTAFQEAISRPVKSFGGIAGMQGFVITLSGYSSRTTPTREDIQIAIHATGACMLPVLSRTHSTHLLCFEAKGEKFKKAQSWRFENIVGHQVRFYDFAKLVT